jgi:zinc/manganese transport system substrate-binding protein
MKRMLFLIGLMFAYAPQAAWAGLRVFACEPEWASLARELGGDRLEVYVATTARQDPHRIEARPSLIAQARRADLLLCTGGGLEVGWLPILLAESGNGAIQPGRPGYFEATSFVAMIEKPARVDRSLGDMHPEGNPHIHTRPENIARVADALAARLAQVDAPNAAAYRARHADFRARWDAAMQRWNARGAALKGTPVVVRHKEFSYLIAWLGLREVAALEPKPGIEPSAAHLSAVLQALERSPAKLAIYGSYANARASLWLAERAPIPALQLPYTVGGSERAADLFGLFDDTLDKLLGALK